MKVPVVVVGAGIAGAAVAFCAAQAGHAVTVVAADEGGVATHASFGWINASWGNPPAYAALRLKAMAGWRDWAARLPDLPVRLSGAVLWDLSPAAMEAFAAAGPAQGQALDWLDGAGVRAHVPGLATVPDRALFAPADGAAEAAAVASRLIALSGARVVRARVTALDVGAGAVRGVLTEEGRVPGAVVLAAGLGAVNLAAGVGVALPLSGAPGLLIRTAPHAGVIAPVVLAPGLHLRQAADGALIAGGDYGGSDPGTDPQAVADGLHRALTALFGPATPPLSAWRTGVRPMPGDGLPILGPVAGVPGLHLALAHSAVTLAPQIGAIVTAGLGGQDAGPWSPARLRP